MNILRYLKNATLNYLSPSNNHAELACFALYALFLVAFLAYPVYHYYQIR